MARPAGRCALASPFVNVALLLNAAVCGAVISWAAFTLMHPRHAPIEASSGCSSNIEAPSPVIHMTQVAVPAAAPWPPALLSGVRAARPVTLPSRSVLLVVAYGNEDIAWLSTHVPHLPHILIASNTSGAMYQQIHPAGREAGAFLYFLVMFYDSLPDIMAFLHAHRVAYHTHGKDMAALLQRVKWDSINAYTPLNLREYNRWIPGYANWDWIRANWREYFADIAPEAPEYAEGYCCAQFVVTRELVRRHPRHVYERLLAFVADVGRYKERDPPRIMEHMWHMLFGQPPVNPTVDICDVLHCEAGQPI